MLAADTVVAAGPAHPAEGRDRGGGAALPGAAVRPPPPRDDRGRADRAGRASRRAARAERGRLRAAERAARSTPTSPAASGAARRAATPSRAVPRRSSRFLSGSYSNVVGLPLFETAQLAARAWLAAAVTPRILAASSPGEVRVAVLRGETLLDYAIWRPGAPDGVGDIHRGRVIARVPAMAGTFVGVDRRRGVSCPTAKVARVCVRAISCRSASPVQPKAVRVPG